MTTGTSDGKSEVPVCVIAALPRGHFKAPLTTSRTYPDHVPNLSRPRSEAPIDTFRSGGGIRSEPICTLFRGTHRYVPNLSRVRSEPIDDYLRTYPHYVPNLSTIRSEPIDDYFGTYRWGLRNVSMTTSERIDTHLGTTSGVFRNYSMGSSEILDG